MSRNFTADVDTQREYFNASYFNNSGNTQIAKYDTTLLKPFFEDPDKWKLAINRMRIPLSGIPLTKNNIPRRQWQVGLSYQPTQSTQLVSDVEYVKQYNGVPVTVQTLNVASTTNISIYDNTFTDQFSSVNFVANNLGTFLIPAYDNINGGTLYYGQSVNVVESEGIFIISSSTGQTLQNIPNPTALYPDGVTPYSMCVNPANGDLFVVYDPADPNLPSIIIQYQRTNNTWTQIFTYPMPPGNTDGIISSNFFSNRIYFIGFNTNTDVTNLYYFNVGSTTLNTVLAIDADGSNAFLTSNGQYLYTYTTNANNISSFTSYTVSGTNLVVNANVTLPSALQPIYDVFPSFGFDNSGNSLLNFANGNKQAYNSQGIFQYNFTPPSNAVLIYPGTSTGSELEGGLFDIFTYQQFLNKINDAFQLSFTNLKTSLGASFIPTQAPRVVFDANTKLFSMICEGQYLTLDASGNNIYQILINNTLWSKFLYPSREVSPLAGFHSILLQNNGINAVAGTGSATLPQYIYVQQEQSTIYAFYDLVRIIVGTTLIPVSGDGEGKTFSNTGFTSNSAINMITDIVPDTTVLTPGSVLIYIPAGILRWYNLYAQQPFQRVDLILYYETKDGTIYPIQIVNGEFFSVKLEFKKGPGDF
jgi:hypothetical protein